MIIVVGRPGLDEEDRLHRPAGRIAVAAAEAGARVELVGSVGDDPDGERVALALGQAGVGHAALLRDPAGSTPRVGGPGGALPRLEEGDIELGLNYLTECRVLVVGEPLADESLRVVGDAADYHSAQLVVLTEPGARPPADLGAAATVLEMPDADEGAFAELVGRYAAELATGRTAGEAWQAAVEVVGWQRSEDDVATGEGPERDAGDGPGTSDDEP